MFLNFMVKPCISDIKHFIVQLTHTTLKNVELLKYVKNKKTALICFGLQGNHHQGATASTYLKLHNYFNVDTKSSYKTFSVLWLFIMSCEACVLCMCKRTLCI